MFDLEQAIAAWRRQMAKNGVERPDLLDELESHLREDTLRFSQSGASHAEAFQAAVRELGDGAALGNEFAAAARAGSSARARAIALNVLGWWLILCGLNSLSVALRILLWDDPQMWSAESLWSRTSTSNMVRLWLELALSYWPIYLGVAAQVLAGIGLLRRRNLWRRVALVLCSLACFAGLMVLILPRAPMPSNPIRLLLLGMPVSHGVWDMVQVIAWLMAALGIRLLAGKRGRSQFLKPAA